MKVYQTNEIKNIALLGNDGSGKTTLTEALLYESGIIKRRGRITAKNTVSDYFPVEQELTGARTSGGTCGLIR
jgi:elongation factor G